jgi:hypothetical protein
MILMVGYDGESFDGNEFVDSTVHNDKNLVIQGRAILLKSRNSFRLSFCYCGDFTISIDQVDGSFTGKGIYLKDNDNSIHNP